MPAKLVSGTFLLGLRLQESLDHLMHYKKNQTEEQQYIIN